MIFRNAEHGSRPAAGTECRVQEQVEGEFHPEIIERENERKVLMLRDPFLAGETALNEISVTRRRADNCEDSHDAHSWFSPNAVPTGGLSAPIWTRTRIRFRGASIGSADACSFNCARGMWGHSSTRMSEDVGRSGPVALVANSLLAPYLVGRRNGVVCQ